MVASRLRQLYWWFHEKDDERAQAFLLAFDHICSELKERGLVVDIEITGTVKTSDGRVAQKAAADDPETPEDKRRGP